jgi:hypothetical protein
MISKSQDLFYARFIAAFQAAFGIVKPYTQPAGRPLGWAEESLALRASKLKVAWRCLTPAILLSVHQEKTAMAEWQSDASKRNSSARWLILIRTAHMCANGATFLSPAQRAGWRGIRISAPTGRDN